MKVVKFLPSFLRAALYETMADQIDRCDEKTVDAFKYKLKIQIMRTLGLAK